MIKKLLFLLITPLLLVGCTTQKPIVIYKDIPKDEFLSGKKPYIAAERNFNSVIDEKLRKQIDWKFNQVHDALSQAYYDGTDFVWKNKNYGILNQETFNKLHTKIGDEYQVLFYEESIKQKLKEQTPEMDENINEIKKRIEQFNINGFDIEL